ncbi:MAG: hypothetical protein KGJ79_14090 [Alphaproteobacteria bacterium]|nr:hypothetical protein [Alphaproteobacteria bacterium]MDE2494396.1 hypothetical protein [Alphaproteobacteria bacterium]
MKAFVISVALLLATAAAPSFAKDDVCLMHRFVDGWGAHGDHAMVVNDKFGRKYLVSLAGLCDDINYAWAAGFRSLVGNVDSCVERGDKVIMRGGGVLGHDVCWVTKVERYTPEMEKAYREALEAKRHQHSD